MIDNIKYDLENVSAETVSYAYKELGLNLIVRQIAPYVDFFERVFDMQAYKSQMILRY